MEVISNGGEDRRNSKDDRTKLESDDGDQRRQAERGGSQRSDSSCAKHASAFLGVGLSEIRAVHSQSKVAFRAHPAEVRTWPDSSSQRWCNSRRAGASYGFELTRCFLD